MLSDGYSVALRCALQSATRLWWDVKPLPTNLWAMRKVKEKFGKSNSVYTYEPLNASDNEIIHTTLRRWVAGLPRKSLKRWIEQDYLDKYYTFRNWYMEIGMRNQADVAPWFNFGRKVPKGFYGYLVDFWRKLVKSSYYPLKLENIKCPDAQASTGLAFTSDGWIYSSDAGQYWTEIQEGASMIFGLLDSLAPSWSDLLNPRYRNPGLESLTLDTPVIRTESGPLKIRWAQSHGKHLYVIERAYIEPLQAIWNDSPFYIGKASNCKQFATSFDEWKGKRPIVGTHGDDWIAVFRGSKWASGDWSSYDLLTQGVQDILSRQALSQVLNEETKLETEWDRVLRSLAYINTKRRTIWPWAKVNGHYIRRASVRRKEGAVVSGSGDFVLHNNARNRAALQILFEPGYEGWKQFSLRARRMLGWVAKPSAQRLSCEGFVACRTLFLRENDWNPWPCAASVLRNWVRPAYNPLESPNPTRLAMATRLRELNVTLGYLPDSEYEALIRAVGSSAISAGAHDPFAQEYSEAELSRMYQKLFTGYSQSAFLQS